MVTESTEAHLTGIESLNLAIEPLVQEMQTMMRWADSSVRQELTTIKFHLLSAENYTELIANVKASNLIRVPTMSTEQTKKLGELMTVVTEMQGDMDEAVKELKIVVEQCEKVQ